MTEREKKFLSDILTSIHLIEEFTHELQSFAEYQSDIKTRSAVERHVAIIGEAVNQFVRASSGNSLTNATQIVAVRNRLIHAYDSIDDAIMWLVITGHLVPLKEEVQGLLG